MVGEPLPFTFLPDAKELYADPEDCEHVYDEESDEEGASDCCLHCGVDRMES